MLIPCVVADRRHIGRALLEAIKKAVASFLLLQQCKMEYAPIFASATTLHLPWTGKAPPGDPPASRIGRVGGASLYCTLGGSGGSEPASPQEKGVQPTGLASRR